MGKKNNNHSGGGWSLNKVSFWLIVITAILYLVGMILHFVGLPAVITGILQSVAAAIMICIVGILGWRYVRNKSVVWLILYIIVLLLVLVGIVLPLAIPV